MLGRPPVPLQDFPLPAFLYKLARVEVYVLRSLVLAVCIATTLLAEAQEGKILTYRKPDPSIPPLAVQLKKSVVSIELQCKEGNSLVGATGTGFIVGYDDPRLPKGFHFNYLVTNRHVAECWDEHNRPRGVQLLTVRVNAVDGPARSVREIPASGASRPMIR